MKPRLFVLFLLMISVAGFSQTTFPDGEYIEYYEDGKTVKCTGAYLNDLKEGAWTDWSRDGKVEMLVNYSRGKRNGYFALCYYSGKLKREGVMCNDKECGLVYEYDANGNLISKSQNVNNAVDLRKVSTYYAASGKPEGEYFLRNGIKDSTEKYFWENGKTKKLAVYTKSGEIQSLVTLNENGDTTAYKNAKGNYSVTEVEEYLPENYVGEYRSKRIVLRKVKLQKKEEETQTQDKYSDSYKSKYSYDDDYSSTYESSFYYRNGKLAYKKNYVKGKREGLYIVQDSSGQTIYSCSYVNGKRNGKEQKYFRNGKLAEEKNYANGKLEGKSLYYNDKGILVESKEYSNDYRNGTFMEYKENGKPEKMYVYKYDRLAEEYTFNEAGKKIKVDLNKPVKFTPPVIEDVVGIVEEAPLVEVASVQQEEEAFMTVEEMPEFPGGETAMREYVAKNIQYPQYEKDAGIQGKCYIEFVIEKDGSVSNPVVKRGVPGGYGCDKEAMRVIKSMPKWKPGKQNGKIVRVKYVIPVQFKLQ